jgi:hypothetical protein
MIDKIQIFMKSISMRCVRSDGRRLAVAILVSALTLGGCSGDPSTPVDTFPRVAIAGTVTLDGGPLPRGMIQFDPAPGTAGPTAAGEIRGGKFAIEKAQGPVPGKYQVRISGRPAAKIKEGEAPGGTPKPTPETVPARYNAESSIEIEVPAGGSLALEFALKKS